MGEALTRHSPRPLSDEGERIKSSGAERVATTADRVSMIASPRRNVSLTLSRGL